MERSKEMKIEKILLDHKIKNIRSVLDIGCGNRKRGTIGIDLFPGKDVDIVHDINNGIPLPNDSIDEILMFHILEHLKEPINTLKEARRVLKKGGKLIIRVPHHTNPNAYEIHHRFYFNSKSLAPIFTQPGDNPKSLEAEKLFLLKNIYIRLLPSKIYLLRAVQHIIQFIVNKYSETYEKRWCYFFPAYEIEYILIKPNN